MRRRNAEICSKGDGEAIRICAQALRQHPDCHAFLKRLEIHRTKLGQGSKVVLSTAAFLFQYLESPRVGEP